MSYRSRPLKRLNNKEFLEDIKKYIKNTHQFYTDKVPEINVLADRLHDEYMLSDFYKVFNKLWRSGQNSERSLAIHALEQYYNDFDLQTWQVLKPKLADIKSVDEIDHISKIISFIYRRQPSLRAELIRLSMQSNVWFRRIAIFSLYNLIKRKELKESELVMKLLLSNIHDRDEDVQKATGFIIRELGKLKKESIKRFILKHMTMPDLTFSIATEHMKDLRKIRRLKKLTNVHRI